jgi:hypothetical protein
LATSARGERLDGIFETAAAHRPAAGPHVTDGPFPTSLRRNPDDPRPLIERISAQLRERIEEAADMAGLGLMLDLRRVEGRPAPEDGNAADIAELHLRALELLTGVAAAFRAELAAESRSALAATERTATDERARLLAGQVHLARTLPDYWQRFEAHRTAYCQARLSAPTAPGSWIRRILRGPARGGPARGSARRGGARREPPPGA